MRGFPSSWTSILGLVRSLVTHFRRFLVTGCPNSVFFVPGCLFFTCFYANTDFWAPGPLSQLPQALFSPSENTLLGNPSFSRPSVAAAGTFPPAKIPTPGFGESTTRKQAKKSAEWGQGNWFLDTRSPFLDTRTGFWIPETGLYPTPIP